MVMDVVPWSISLLKTLLSVSEYPGVCFRTMGAGASTVQEVGSIEAGVMWRTRLANTCELVSNTRETRLVAGNLPPLGVQPGGRQNFLHCNPQTGTCYYYYYYYYY